MLKVFISHSGNRSQLVARNLKTWLKQLLQQTDPFMSAVDTKSGTIWSQELSREIAASNFGVVCVTADNLESP